MMASCTTDDGKPSAIAMKDTTNPNEISSTTLIRAFIPTLVGAQRSPKMLTSTVS